jgi:hypothetical protein
MRSSCSKNPFLAQIHNYPTCLAPVELRAHHITAHQLALQAPSALHRLNNAAPAPAPNFSTWYTGGSRTLSGPHELTRKRPVFCSRPQQSMRTMRMHLEIHAPTTAGRAEFPQHLSGSGVATKHQASGGLGGPSGERSRSSAQDASCAACEPPDSRVPPHPPLELFCCDAKLRSTCPAIPQKATRASRVTPCQRLLLPYSPSAPTHTGRLGPSTRRPSSCTRALREPRLCSASFPLASLASSIHSHHQSLSSI